LIQLAGAVNSRSGMSSGRPVGCAGARRAKPGPDPLSAASPAPRGRPLPEPSGATYLLDQDTQIE